MVFPPTKSLNELKSKPSISKGLYSNSSEKPFIISTSLLVVLTQRLLLKYHKTSLGFELLFEYKIRLLIFVKLEI